MTQYMQFEPKNPVSPDEEEPVHQKNSGLDHFKTTTERKKGFPKIGLVISVIFLFILTNGITFYFSHSSSQGVIADLEAKYDGIAPKIEDYLKGVEESETISRKPAEKDEPADVTVPETTAAPFEKDGIIVVNKKHPLPIDYAPGEDPEAVTHLKEFIDKAQNSGIDIIYAWSGFRSYDMQAGLFAGYSAQSGVEAAETFSARPGYSEHQTGLAFDLKEPSGNLYRGSDGSYNYDTDWVAKNAPEYGFIIRYRDVWQDETGYVGEPWHLRYLGKETAKAVYNSGKSLEIYLGVEGGDYVR